MKVIKLQFLLHYLLVKLFSATVGCDPYFKLITKMGWRKVSHRRDGSFIYMEFEKNDVVMSHKVRVVRRGE